MVKSYLIKFKFTSINSFMNMVNMLKVIILWLIIKPVFNYFVSLSNVLFNYNERLYNGYQTVLSFIKSVSFYYEFYIRKFNFVNVSIT